MSEPYLIQGIDDLGEDQSIVRVYYQPEIHPRSNLGEEDWPRSESIRTSRAQLNESPPVDPLPFGQLRSFQPCVTWSSCVRLLSEELLELDPLEGPFKELDEFPNDSSSSSFRKFA